MKIQPFLLFIPCLVSLVLTAPCAGQPATRWPVSISDSGTCFLYIDNCRMKYNPARGKQELEITAMVLPATLLKKFPQLRNNGLYSTRNCKIVIKQQQMMQQYKAEKVRVCVNRDKFNMHYPHGLKRGQIIGYDEFIRWDFLVNPVPPAVPAQDRKESNHKWKWFVTDPVNIHYGLMVIS